MSTVLHLSPSPSPTRRNFSFNDTDDDGTDQASQRSISLSSPTKSTHDAHDPKPLSSLSTSHSFNQHVISDAQYNSMDKHASVAVSESTSSIVDTRRSSEVSSLPASSMKYPPVPARFASDNDSASMTSYSSTSSRKARPESSLIEPPAGPLVPGIALVDFNHLVGPKVEFCEGDVFDDEQMHTIMPFLALPDGAHLSVEDYSYFHLVPSSPRPTTVFGISCNRQIKASDLLARNEDVTRSTVQKAVVVLASKPLFGPIRDRLGVVTKALFDQRDFRETNILVDFRKSLESSLRSQLTESALYMGTNLRELVHKFRGRTLLLLKTLMLQKRILLYGHPVERLCTYQYSLISLIPGLLQNLDDCGSPPLNYRSSTLSRATSLRTSDRKSLLAYVGLPLDIFGKDAFFQPYLPLQQVDLLKDTPSYLCGSTNTIVTQQKEIDLLINIETNTFEFRDPKLERLVGLTAADRKWMDEILRDVNDAWDDTNSIRSKAMLFKGSDDYLRAKFEEYVSAALASVKYSDFIAKSEKQDVVITDAGDANAINDFNLLWIAEFKKTNAFEMWNRITDPMLFDIVEARHPCTGKPNVVEDIGLRLQEGLQDLHIQEQLAPTREAISRTIASSSTSFFKAVEGVRGRWAQRSASSLSVNGDSTSTLATTPVEISHSEADLANASASKLRPLSTASAASQSSQPQQSQSSGLRPFALSAAQTANETKATLSTWGSNLGSFISQRASRLTVARTSSGASDSALTQGSSSSSSYSTQPPSANASPPLGTAASEGMPQQRLPSSPPPLTSILSSWSWKAKPSTPPTQPKPPLEEEEIDPVFKPKDLGEFTPVTTKFRTSTDTGDTRNTRVSTEVQPGMAL